MASIMQAGGQSREETQGTPLWMTEKPAQPPSDFLPFASLQHRRLSEASISPPGSSIGSPSRVICVSSDSLGNLFFVCLLFSFSDDKTFRRSSTSATHRKHEHFPLGFDSLATQPERLLTPPWPVRLPRATAVKLSRALTALHWQGFICVVKVPVN